MTELNLRRIVLDSYVFYTKMDLPTNDLVTPLAGYLQKRYDLDESQADSWAVKISLKATIGNGARLFEILKSGEYALLKKYNLRDVVRNALKQLEN